MSFRVPVRWGLKQKVGYTRQFFRKVVLRPFDLTLFLSSPGHVTDDDAAEWLQKSYDGTATFEDRVIALTQSPGTEGCEAVLLTASVLRWVELVFGSLQMELY